MFDTPSLIALLALTSGAYQDWKGRTATNLTWTAALAIALPFLLAEPLTTGWNAVAWRWGTAALVSALAFTLWTVGQMGAADSKAIMLTSLLLSPYSYWNPDQASFIPAVDALLPSLLLAEAWRRMARMQGTPFLVILAPVTALTLAFGGLLWWPLIWIARLLQVSIQ